MPAARQVEGVTKVTIRHLNYNQYQGLRLEVEEFSLPDLEAEYTEEEGERLDAALEKYNDIRQSLAETQVGNKYKAKGSMSLKSVVES